MINELTPTGVANQSPVEVPASIAAIETIHSLRLKRESDYSQALSRHEVRSGLNRPENGCFLLTLS
jgi:hypothetical protein